MSRRDSNRARAEEKELRDFVKALRSAGVDVRRENLSRGLSYRVKSGDCRLEGQDILFIDRRLPAEQQRLLLTDFSRENSVTFDSEAVETLLSERLKLEIFPLNKDKGNEDKSSSEQGDGQESAPVGEQSEAEASANHSM